MSLEEKKKSASILNQWRSRKKNTLVSKILPRPIDSKTIPSNGQRRLWLLQQLYPQNPFYQYAHLYTIDGELDVSLLEQSIQQLSQRHEILRTNFIKNEHELEVIVKPQASYNIQCFDLRSLSEEDQEVQIKLLIDQESKKLFDLEESALLRFSLIQIADFKFQMVLSIHHIIGDRWSLRLLNEELFKYYKYLKSGEVYEPEPLHIQYTDFAHWQKTQETKTNDLEYWIDNLSGDLPLLSLPTDFKHPKSPSFKGGFLTKKIKPGLSKKLKQLAQESEVTMYVLMLSAFKILLYKYSNQADLIVGSPFSNRDKVDLEKLIGFFNETIVLRTQLEPDWTFKALLSNVKKTTLKAFEHKNVPFEELVRVVQAERHGNANPIFQSMFLYNSVLPFSIPDLDLEIEDQMIDLGVSKFDLTLFVNEYSDHLELSLEFSHDLFKKETVDNMFRHLEVILESIVEDDTRSIIHIPILDQIEKNKILVDWNNNEVSYPNYSSIHDLIEEQAVLNPHQLAVSFQGKKMTYAELNDKANSIALHLIESGIQINQSVGLYTHRSIELIISILGILKSGAAYLPLDPEYPLERIKYMIEDSKVPLVLCQKALKSNIDSIETNIITIESSLEKKVSKNLELPNKNPENLAYTIYTSGSTGRPKGVPIRHKNLLHSTLSRYSFYPNNPEAFLLLSSFSFDSSVVGIFWTLCSGGTLVLPPKRIEQDVFLLTALIAKHKVSHTLMLPSLYSAILNHASIDQIRSLKNVMVAGEACPFSLIEKHFDRLPETALYNEYGPTEASVWCIAHKIQAEEKDFVPIGKAIPNTEAYILNPALQAVPIGVPGELFIGGLGLAEGYLNRPKLTAERFLNHPFKKGEKIYRTGDLARFHKDGRIEFLGRVDHQVKIRGFRVEPEEIQKRILENDLVAEALVIVHESSKDNQQVSKRLVAYTSYIEEDQIKKLLETLNGKLPAYMVPSFIIPLKEFPRLPNGKINQKQLPDPNNYKTIKTRNFLVPETETEKQLATIWESVLGIESISISDNFFSIGGDSILSIQILSKARDQGIFLAPNQIFEHQTIEALAKSVEESASENLQALKSTFKINNPSAFELSYLQKAFLFNNQKSETDQGLLQLEFTIAGNIDYIQFKKAWQKSAERHDAIRAFISSDKGQKHQQEIAPEVDLMWQYHNWQTKSAKEQNEALEQVRLADQASPLDLYNAPTSRLQLIQTQSNKHLLLWTCHHIFLDGWSCGIILKDALSFYSAIQKKEELNLVPLPNFLAYLDWKKQEDSIPGIQYWTKALASFSKPLLFKKAENSIPVFKDINLKLSIEESLNLEQFCQQNDISLSTLFQGFWALVLSILFENKDVVYGLTVSGRFSAFPQLDLISGLFMNVIPNRFKINTEENIQSWLQSIQKNQGQKNQHESKTLDEIKKANNWSNHKELFDVLFVFGNFLKNGLKIGALEVEHFQGGFSSSYPLTIRVNPLQAIEIDWRYDSSILNQEQIIWIKNTLYKFLLDINSFEQNSSIQHLINHAKLDSAIPNSNIIKSFSPPLEIKNKHQQIDAYSPPRNKTELDFCTIWGQLFNRNKIGIHDNFFDLGGKSLLAIELFSTIEKELGIVFSPSILFKHPTIATLVASLSELTDSSKDVKVIVPLRKGSQRAPLFCVHGGGAHVFFYKSLTTHLPEDQPVYSIQPPGLNGQATPFPNTIEAMASHYIQAIKTIQDQGPYHLLGTCFSNAVVLEMANQLQAEGAEIKSLFIIDSAPVHLFGNDTDGKRKTLTRFYDMLKRGDYKRIQRKIKGRFIKKEMPPTIDTTLESSNEKHLRLTIDSLNKLYADYHWKAFNGKIYFIRSSEFHDRSDKNYHLVQWNKLAKKGVDLHVVSGHHLTLFDEPEVQGLADKINECINISHI